nr:PREDICTED: general transcription factor II-I repeat domain-containing protein 2B-like [Latimeria chalumnae]|eukprot:XP_014339756.1 PREDICTED: general transcription factor II-I repeat domain-containing protein 2B-like [Latimeria chalumnae]
MHNNVRWLSHGKVLACFAACLKEIKTFLEMKGVTHPELSNCDWLLKFYYLVDITGHLNQLNVKLQGQGNTVLSLQQAVFAFESKLNLFIRDIKTGRLTHFEMLRMFRDSCMEEDPSNNLDLQQLVVFTSDLLMSFKSCFVEFRRHSTLFKFMIRPHETCVEALDLTVIPGISVGDLELEVADFKESDIWVEKFHTLNSNLENLARQCAELSKLHKWNDLKKLECEDNLILQSWNELPLTYGTMQNVSFALLTMFGSTYMCEQAFSHLNHIKNNLRSRLTEDSLNACMKLNLTTYELDFKEIHKTMQQQKSH